MANSLQNIFNDSPDIETFRKNIESLHGLFDFNSVEMISLGEAYYERFPESFHNRDMDAVHYGYKIVRICIVEKMLSDFNSKKKALYRGLFLSMDNVQRGLELLKTHFPKDVLKIDYKKMFHQLEKYKRIIDEIPKGMVKERYVGGITYLYNALYFIQMSLK